MAEAPANQSNFRVVVADDDGVFGRQMCSFLNERGFATQLCPDGKSARQVIKEWKPHFVMGDLTLRDGNAFDLLKFIKTDPEVKDIDIKFFVVSVHNNADNVKALIKAGATDYLIRPFKNDDVLTRMVFHIQSKREIETPKDQSQVSGADVHSQLLDIVLKEAVTARSLNETLLKFTKMVGITLKAVRCSIVEVSDDMMYGRVLASSDDRGARGIRLDLNRYPEIIHVINTEKAVAIEDLDYNPQLAAIKAMFKNISFNSMIVCPVFQRGAIYGVMSARMDSKAPKFTDRDLRFCQSVAMVASLALSSDLALPHEMFGAPKVITPGGPGTAVAGGAEGGVPNVAAGTMPAPTDPSKKAS